MERWLVKILSLLIIFSITVTATLLPLKLKDLFEKWGKTGQRILSYMMCFGGGVFFSIYMLHMAPDALAIVSVMICIPYGITYPVGELMISMGFFLMVFSEKIVLKYMNKTTEKTSTKKVIEPVETYAQDHIGMKLSMTSEEDNGGHLSLELLNNLRNQISETGTKEESEALNSDEHECQTTIVETGTNVHQPGHSHDMAANLTGTRSLILLLALSLHHVFEGISVGLKHSAGAVWNLTIAILCHEVVISFSLGLQLVKAYKSTKKIVLAAVMCTLMVPIGIAIGMALMETGHGESRGVNIANGILQSLATGVFIYVTFFEILLEEISHEETSMMKLMWMLVGFVTMALLGIIPEDTGVGVDSGNCTLICV